MTRPAERDESPGRTERPGAAATRGHGPAVGEPPLLVDPRRWGSLIGLTGGVVFVGSYSSGLGPVVSTVAWVLAVAGVLATLFAHYVRPGPLGPLTRPRPLDLALYGGCVLGEFVLIALGSRALTAVDRGDLRPALIAAVVGLHFIPFARAFRERMFLRLGGTVAVIGAAGLLAGALRVPHAADASAVLAGLVMIAILAAYARGRFTGPRPPGTAR